MRLIKYVLLAFLIPVSLFAQKEELNLKFISKPEIRQTSTKIADINSKIVSSLAINIPSYSSQKIVIADTTGTTFTLDSLTFTSTGMIEKGIPVVKLIDKGIVLDPIKKAPLPSDDPSKNTLQFPVWIEVVLDTSSVEFGPLYLGTRATTAVTTGVNDTVNWVENSAFYDAILLADESKSCDLKLKVLAKYYGIDGFDATSFNKNPFFSTELKTEIGSCLPSANAEGDYIINLPSTTKQDIAKSQSLSSAISGLDVTTFSDGLAQFLIDRSKEELNIAFFKRFEKFLDENKEAQILFPRTSNFLISRINSFEYADFISALRTAFKDDLDNLIFNIDNLFQLPKYRKMIVDSNVVEVPLLLDIVQLSVSISSNKAHASDVLRQLETLPTWTEWKTQIDSKHYLKNAKNGIVLTNVLSNALKRNKSSANEPYWITRAEFTDSIIQADNQRYKNFLGLVYRRCQEKEVNFYDSSNAETKFTEFLESIQDEIYVSRQILLDFMNIANRIDYSYQLIKDSNQRTSRENIYVYINESINLIEFGSGVARRIDSDIDLGEFLNHARNASDLSKNILLENYGAAAVNATDILVSCSQYIDPALNSRKEVRKTYSGSDECEKKKEFKNLDRYSNYITFMANMVSASDADEVKSAIETAALPVGSSSVKKYYWHNISINAYLGANLNASFEEDQVSQSWDSRFGVTAPIGIAYTPLSMARGGSISLFGSIIDVGAIAQFRLSNDSTQIEEKIELGNIFSPGAYIVYGCAWDWPISLGFGAQYGPGLFKVDNVDASLSINQPDVRFNFFLAVDIPLANVYRGRKRL